MIFGSRQKKRIYADAAAATPLSVSAERELLRLLPLFGNAGALHTEAVEAKKELEAARAKVARSIGAHADEIIFTASGTEGNNLALHGTLRPLLLKHGELKAITSAVEHQSVLAPLAILEREGLYTSELPVNGEGLVDPAQLAEEINDETVLISVQLVNSEVGTIEPIKEIAKVIRHARKNRTNGLPLYLHTDASQAPLWVKVGVEQLGVDLMTLDAQKVLGPKGVGCLYVRRNTKVEPILWGGKQEFNLRGGTENVPLAGSFAVALEEAQAGVDERAARVEELRDFCISEMKRLVPDSIINGPAGEHRVANNINVSVPGLEAEMAVIAMDALGVAVSTRSACNIGSDEPSHVITALGTPKELAGTAIRITLLPDIARAEAARIARSLADAAQRYRQR
jgi:cysteine desulfurase